MVHSLGRFAWYELVTTDVAGAKAFYARVIGWGTAATAAPSYTLFTAGETPVSGVTGLPEEAMRSGLRPRWVGYVGVDDVDAAAARIERLGGAVHVPPTDVPNISRFSIAADPQMATIAVLKWVNGGQEEPADLDAPGRVGWHELLAADWEKAFAYYREVFGWQKARFDADAGGAYQLFSAGGQTIGGMFTKPASEPVPFWLYYFNVGDIDETIRRVKAGGGRIVNGPIEVLGNRWIVQCTDPQGAIFALVGKRSHNAIGYFAPAARKPSPGARN
jgi:uncharacterized protein